MTIDPIADAIAKTLEPEQPAAAPVERRGTPRPGSFAESAVPVGPRRPQAVDPLDAAVSSVIAAEDTQVKSNVMAAVRTKPDAAVDARRLAVRNGVPEDVVLRNLEQVREFDQIKTITAALEKSPALRRQFLDTGFARIAQDDTDNLTKLDTAVNSFKRAWPALKGMAAGVNLVNEASGLDTVRQVDEYLAGGGRLTDLPEGKWAPFAGYIPGESEEKARARYEWLKGRSVPVMQAGLEDAATRSVQAGAERAAIPGAAVTRKVMAAKDWSSALGAFMEAPAKFVLDIGPESIGQNLPAMAASALAPRYAPSIMGANSFVADFSGQITEGLQRKGVNVQDPAALAAALRDPKILAEVIDQASKHAQVVGAVDALSSGIAGRLALPKNAMAGKPLTRELANIGVQAPVQGALGAAGEAGGQLAAGQEIQPGQILAEAAGEFIGTPGEVVSASAGRLRAVVAERQAQVQASAEAAQNVGAMFDLAAESKARERDPQAFGKAVQDMADSSENAPKALHIDGRLLAEGLQQSGMTPEQLAAALPSVADQLAEALTAGGDVVIPIGEAMGFAPGSTLEQTFRDHARPNADALSAVEVKDAEKVLGEFQQAQLQSEVARVQKSEVLRTGRDEVLQTLLGELTAAGRQTADVNRSNALLAANFYAVMAERLGVTPQEMYQRFPLRVRGESPLGGALNQGTWFTGSPDAGRAKSYTLAEQSTRKNAEAQKVGPGQYITMDRGFAETYAGDGGHLYTLDAPFENALDFNKKYDGVYGDKLYANLVKELGSKTKANAELQKRGFDAIMFTDNRGTKLANIFNEKPLTSAGQVRRNKAQVELSLQPLEGGQLSQSASVGNVEAAFEAALEDDPFSEYGLRVVDDNVSVGEKLKPSRVWVDGVASEDTLAGTSVIELKKGRVATALKRTETYQGSKMLLVKGERAQPGEDAGERVITDAEVVAVFDRGELNQQARGTFSPSNLTIALLQQADLSTFTHELGHFALEVLTQLAAQPGALEQTTKDVDALMKWFGVKDVATWRALSLDEQRPYHEKFAESFEQYLFEGKAPSTELQPLFNTIRAWMTSVYKTLAKFLNGRNLQLNDEVRGVFDRMLASDEAIAEAQALREYFPLFTDAAQAGMTPQEWAAYQRKDDDAVADAQTDMQSRSLRDMKWLSGAKSKALRMLQKEGAEKRRAVEAEVTAEVDASPIEQARRRVKELRVTSPEDKAAVKAWQAEKAAEQSRVEAQVKEETLATPEAQELKGIKKGQFLAKKKRAMANEVERRMLEWEAQNEKPKVPIPDLQMDALAEQFGFSSGAELTEKMRTEPSRAVAIEAGTDLRVLERYGDTTTPQGIERAANEAVHNEARGRFVASEFRSAAKIATPTRALVTAAKQFAAQLIARRKVRDVSAAPHRAAEVRAARAAREALAKGDMQGLSVATRDRMLQFYAAKEAAAATTEIEKKVDYLKKFDKESIRKGLPPEYVDQIDQLLERFDLRKSTTNAEIDKRKTLAEWIESQQELGIEPNLPDLVARSAKLVSYKELTVEEFRGLVDSVKQIEHLGRLKNKLLTAKDQREFEATRDLLLSTLQANGQGRKVDPRSATTPWGRRLEKIRDFGSAHIKAAAWLRVFDGAQDGGAFWEYLARPANEAGDMETRMRAEATEKLTAILAPAVKGQAMNKGRFFASVNRSFTKQELLAVALNMGNESNTQRLLGGEGWTMEQIKPVLEALTAADWQAVQGVWDHLETYRPLIAAKERRVTGVEPDWIEARALKVATADGQTVELRGGYYPVRYDPSASIRAEQHADAEGAQRQLKGAYNAATTRRSFTKARADEVFDRPLMYDLSGLYAGVNEVVHDLAWHEWLIDANRMLRDKKIDAAIRNTYGPGASRQLKTWRETIAEGDLGAQAAIDTGLGFIRRSVSVAGLGFNVMSAMMQPLGMTQTIVRIGPKWAGKGIMTYLANPVRATREANRMSKFMADRQRTQFRDLNELRNRVEGKTGPLTTAQTYSYWLMMRVQQMVDVPTWHGAYEKAVAEGNADERAVALADQAVIDAQGSGMAKDLSAIEGGGPAQKLFTVFYSFMNTALNLGYVQARTQESRAKLAVDLLLLYSVPAVLGSAMKMALTPGDAGEDEEIVKKLAADQLQYLFGLVVLGRETGGLATGMLGLDKHFQDYKGPAGLRAFADLFNLGKQVSQGEFDDAFRKAAVNSMGSLFGLPAAQINRTWTGTEALAEGETSNPLAILFGHEKPR